MITNTMKKSFLYKAVSLCLVFTFAFYNVSFAVTPEGTGVPEAKEIKQPLSIADIGIEIDSGTIKSSHEGKSGKIIVHIQDAHCNYEAQGNINKMLDQLYKECGIDIISVEGAEGLVDTAWFRAFPDAEIRKEVATYFMKKGEITGAEFFSITSDYQGTIFGAETRDYYIKNLKAFTDVYPYKNVIEKYFLNLRTVANRLKSIVYPAKLKEVDLKIRAFEAKEIKLSDYADYLYKNASKYKVKLDDAPNFKKLVDTLEYEQKIDFDVVDAERGDYIDLLSKKMTKEKMTELVSESIRFKKGHIKAVDFYSFLRGLAKEYDIPIIQEFPNLFYYYIYTKLYDGIDNEGLFRELGRTQTRLKEKLFTDDLQKKLDKYADMGDLYVDLVNIELTNEDYDLFKEYREEFTLGDMVSFMGSLVAKYNLNYSLDGVPGQIENNLPNMIDFYEIAMLRDNALINNTLKQMEKEKRTSCVLIAGGFHTRGIKSILEKKGISYVVVTPKITKDVETPYIKVLTNQRTSLEDIITESAAMPGMGTTSREDIVQPRGDMLSPLGRVFYTLRMYFTHRAELQAISGEIGPITLPDGRQITLMQASEEQADEVTGQFVNTWLNRVRENSDPEQWQGVVDNWQTISAAYQNTYADPDLAAGTVDQVRVAIKGAFDQAFGAEEELIERGPEDQDRDESVGEEATGPMSSLLAEQFILFDKMLEGRFAEAQPRFEELASDEDIEKYGHRIYLHDAIEDEIAEKNYERLLAGETYMIPVSRVHPGTWSGRQNQQHMSTLSWRSLTPEQRVTVAQHEQVHIDIYNYLKQMKAISEKDEEEAQKREALLSAKAPRTIELWEKYQAYCADKKIPVDQEYFVDIILSGSMLQVPEEPAEVKKAVEKENQKRREIRQYIGLDRREYYNTDTTRAREKMVEAQALRIHDKTQRALDNIDFTSPKHDESTRLLRIALIEAFVYADQYNYPPALEGVINLIAARVKRYPAIKEECRAAFYEVAQWYPVWVRRDLMADLTPGAEELMREWFNELDADKGIDPKKNLLALIMCGGFGTRLTPLSNDATPKQLAKILDIPLVVMSVQRVIDNLGVDNVYIQTIPGLVKAIYDVLLENGIELKKENIFAEPYAADTAGAIGYGAAKLARLGRGNDVMFVATSDHYIDTSTDAFQNAYMDAAKIARNTPSIGTIGINPAKIGASEELGCIRKGSRTFFEAEGAVVADTFIEKPKGARAIEVFEEKLEDGSHAWNYNSGMFVGQPETFLRAFDLVAPYYGKKFRAIANASPAEAERLEEQIFAELAETKGDKKFPHTGDLSGSGFRTGVSIDYVVAQAISASRGETSQIALFMMEGVFDWIDVGGYKAVHKYYTEVEGRVYGETPEEKANRNVVLTSDESEVTLEDCEGCLVVAWDNVTIDLKGLKDSLVVYNPDTKAVMIAPLDVSGDSIKNNLLDKNTGALKANKNLRGYSSGDPKEIVDVVKTRGEGIEAIVNVDADDRTVLIEKSGNGLIIGSKGCEVEVDLENGLAIVLDMEQKDEKGKEDKDAFLNVYVGVDDARGTPSITVTQNAEMTAEERAKLDEGSHTVFQLAQDYSAREARLQTTLRMIQSGILGLPVASLDAPYYAMIWSETRTPALVEGEDEIKGITRPEAEDEVETIKRRLERYDYLMENDDPVKAGTSGQRGKDSQLTDKEVYINALGTQWHLMNLAANAERFPLELRDLIAKGKLTPGSDVALAGDYRPSTPRISVAQAAAIIQAGNKVAYVGNQPTPSVANYGIIRGIPSVMITGSHNPYGENGIKTNRANGELLKPEEVVLQEYIAEARRQVYLQTAEEDMFDENGMWKEEKDLDRDQAFLLHQAKASVDVTTDENQRNAENCEAMYRDHIVTPLGRSLEGEEIIFWQQSAVGRRQIPEIFEALGVDVVSVEPLENDFMPVDTENISGKIMAIAGRLMAEYNRDILFTTDGDSDRPAAFVRMSNDEVKYITGDQLIMLTGVLMQPEFFAVPITANHRAFRYLQDQVEGVELQYEDVGSPYIAAAMQLRNEGRGAVGGEVNGGFLIGAQRFQLPRDVVSKLIEYNATSSAPLALPGGELGYLPTRDSTLPLVALLLLAKIREVSVAELVEETFTGEYAGEIASGLVENVDEHTTPGLEQYTKEQGKLIIKSLSPRDETIEDIYIDEHMKPTVRRVDQTTPESPDAALAVHLGQVVSKLAGYLTQISGLQDERIERVNFKNGIRVFFTNGETIHLRPSGNSAQFRIYPLSADPTLTWSENLARARQIAAQGTRDVNGNDKNGNPVMEGPGILVQIIQDFQRGPQEGPVEIETQETRESVGAFSVAGSIVPAPDRRTPMTSMFKKVMDRGRKLAEDVYTYIVNAVLSRTQEGTVIVSDEIQVFAGEERIPQDVVQNIEGRNPVLSIVQGRAKIYYQDVLVEPLEDQTIVLAGALGEYKIVKESDEAVIARIDYEVAEGEAVIYTAYHLAKKYQGNGFFTRDNRKYGYIAPQELYSAGDVGSVDWRRRHMNAFLDERDAFEIGTYLGTALEDKTLDVAIKAIKQNITSFAAEGRVPVLALPQSLLDKIFETTPTQDIAELQELIQQKGVCIQPIPDIDLDQLKVDDRHVGWFFTREAQVAALMQANLDLEAIDGVDEFTQDTMMFMAQLTGKPMDRDDLYFLLPFDQVNSRFQTVTVDGEEMPFNFFSWAKKLVKSLLLSMPMQPLEYLRERLRNRRHTLWSV